MLSFEDSFDSPDTNRSIACSARGETFSIVSCTASISICHVTDKDRPRGRPAVESPRQRKKRKRETRYFVGGKREREKKRKKRASTGVERAFGRRNKSHFPGRCTDFSPAVSVESPARLPFHPMDPLPRHEG